MQRVAKNAEQVAHYITNDVKRVMGKGVIYTKTEFYKVLNTLCKSYKYPVHEVAVSLANLKVIKEHSRSTGYRYSLMPEGGITVLEELEQRRLERYEETAWLAKFKTLKTSFKLGTSIFS
ncbi:hypothetical protein [Maribacter sp. ACAM166]|uniref:hypothetical protein n=1 Tax=Maribacter sp. ACAM166 TaxID=2508996 RepID=UPI0010FF420A|nr:hypothetical protein [Maribacter sp. ACAM166]TLP80925.1 hypothetical protein ES765_05620 [Maribacter sp. ACAM166]